MPEFSETRFIVLILALLASFILVGAWSRFLDNLAFRTIGLSTSSTPDTLIWAITLTVIFFAVIWFLDRLNIIVRNLEEEVEEDV